MTKEYLKAVRLELKLTQDSMAKKLNTPLRTYQRWEFSESMPGVVEIAIDYILNEHKQGLRK